jgi:predicted 3-demethylubiquinone-9 3-methyltransferase (glyoxalase superfamily)
MFNDAVRIRISADTDDEFHEMVELLKSSGKKLRPFHYIRYKQGHILRVELQSLPDGNPPRLD